MKKMRLFSYRPKRFPKNPEFIEKISNEQKFIENLENLGCAKIKGARNGSDARKLEGREK